MITTVSTANTWNVYNCVAIEPNRDSIKIWATSEERHESTEWSQAIWNIEKNGWNLYSIGEKQKETFIDGLKCLMNYT